MRTYSITEGRRKLGEIVDRVRFQKVTIGLGPRGKAEVLIVPTDGVDIPIGEMASGSKSWAFLDEEPDLYSRKDLRRRYD